MQYRQRFSSDLSTQKLQRIFLGKKFGKRPRCNRCKSDRIYKTDSKTYRCRSCWYKFRLTGGTYASLMRIEIRLWYEIIYSFVLGLPALRTQKVLKVKEYQTIYRAYMVIRKAIYDYSYKKFRKLVGDLEMDEAFYGGRFRNKRLGKKRELYEKGLVKKGRGAVYLKQPVFGIYKRNGWVFLELIPKTGKRYIEPMIEDRVVKGARVYTDTWNAYDGLVIKGYIHKKVDHVQKQYVVHKRGEKIHINGMEGFWGFSKSGLHVYKGIRKKNWKYYLKEYEFRYNFRDLEYEEKVEKIIEILLTSYGKSRPDLT